MGPYQVSPEAIITKLVTYNPKLPGSQARTRFHHYRSGMTVQEFLDAGGRTADIYHDIARSHIATSDYPYSQIVHAIS